MSASASFQIDPGTAVYGAADTAQDAAVSVTVNCRLVSTSGVSSIAWRIFGTHGVAAPAITLSGNPTGQIASFDTAATIGQAYGIECKVNGGAGVTGDAATTQTNALYVLDYLENRPFFIGETYEDDSTYGVVVRLNKALTLRKLNTTAVASSPYNVLDTDVIILLDTTAPRTVNLPAAASHTGRELWIKDSTGNAAANNVTIDGNAAETIDNAATDTISVNYDMRHLFCDGTEWWVIGRR
jgi:hypothetical protein